METAGILQCFWNLAVSCLSTRTKVFNTPFHASLLRDSLSVCLGYVDA